MAKMFTEKQPPIAPTPADTDLTGRTIIVTGGNAGLGLEAARQYITLKALRVILACRSISKGQDAAKYLSNHPTVQSSNPNVEIRVMALDLDDETSVIDFANKVKSELNALDVLLLNAGFNIINYQVSKSGHERVMQVNYHSNVILALALLPLLESTASQRGQPARLTFVGSVAHKMHTLNKKPIDQDQSLTSHWDDEKKYNWMLRYMDSKLMITAFTLELAQHVDPRKVIINTVCPGMVSTGFDVHLPLWGRLIARFMRFLRARTPEVGARTYIYATSIAGAESHGKWLNHNKVDE